MIDLSKLQNNAKKVVAQNKTPVVAKPATGAPVLPAAPVATPAVAPAAAPAPAFGNSALDSLMAAATDGGFKEVDPGTYIAEITKCEMGKTKADGKDMFILGLKVADGEAKGQFITEYRVLTKKDGSVNNFNIRMMKERLTTLTGATPTNGAEVYQLCAHVVATKPMVQVTVTHDTWGTDNRVSVNIAKLSILA